MQTAIRGDYEGSNIILTNRSGLPSTPAISCTRGDVHIDRELSLIDAMDCGESVGRQSQPSARTNATSSDKDSQEKEVVGSDTMAHWN